MTAAHRQARLAIALAGALGAQAAFAGLVTVNVTTRSGSPAADAVIVFDPLDNVPAASRDAAIIDQVDKLFVPRVTVIRTGTMVTFPNSDRIRHQVYSFSHAKTFTLKLYAGSPQTPVAFDQAGLVVLGCNIHDTMVAFVGVVDSPYFAKTADAGSAALDLPPGRYRLRAWHEKAVAPVPAREITVSAAPMSIPVSIDLDAASTTVAVWPE